MKREIRILGIDDMPFSFEDEKTDIVGVIMRGGVYLEGVLKTTIEVDGRDATEKIVEMVENTRHRGQIKIIMIDGIALGGFNVVDGRYIYERAGIPVITITRNKPDMERIREALMKHFDDWRERWEIISREETMEIREKYAVYVKNYGVNMDEVREIIKLSTIRGAIPEPVRVAHLIATGIKMGESHGRC